MRYWKNETDRYLLECWGNGESYSLKRKDATVTNGRIIADYFCQGDDATRFEADMVQAETCFPHRSFNEIMDHLWDDCEYGLASELVQEK